MENERCVRHLRMEHARNLRDMGGYETRDGRVTSFGKLLRCGSLGRLTEKEWDRLYRYGVRSILDLRSDAEIQEEPDQTPRGIVWRHCPLQTEQIDQSDIARSAAEAFAGSLTEGYINMVKNHGELLVHALLSLIGGLESGAVLFHCTAGKDRTGVLASAVYFLVGVEREDIVADYEVTYTYNRRGLNRLFERLDEETQKSIRPLLRSDAENMEQLVSYYETIDLREHLGRKGLTEEAICTLCREFLI